MVDPTKGACLLTLALLLVIKSECLDPHHMWAAQQAAAMEWNPHGMPAYGIV